MAKVNPKEEYMSGGSVGHHQEGDAMEICGGDNLQ
jgi:hypothetical protein